MYDTIKLFISIDKAGGKLLDCLPFLTNLSETYRKDSGQNYIKGNAGNLRVGISEYGISLTGSLARFYLGTNLETLTRESSKQAFEKIADTLHLPIQKATISRLDIGLNLTTDFKPELYYPYLGHSNYYKRLAQPSSIWYQNNVKSKKFYNKMAECRSKRATIPEIYSGKNILRYELSYLQRLPKQFNIATITPDTLTNELFYKALVDRLIKEYEVIQKVGIPNMDKKKMSTPKGFWEQIDALAIQLIGQENLLNLLEEMRTEKSFSNDRNYYRIKDAIRSRASDIVSGTPELILELNEKIKLARNNF